MNKSQKINITVSAALMIAVVVLFHTMMLHALTFHHQNSYFMPGFNFVKESVLAIGGLSSFLASIVCSTTISCAIFIGFTAAYMFYVLTTTAEKISHQRDPFLGAIIPITLLLTQYINIDFMKFVSSMLIINILLHLIINIKGVKLKFICAPIAIALALTTIDLSVNTAKIVAYSAIYLLYCFALVRFTGKSKKAIFIALPITILVAFYIFYKEQNPRLKFVMLMEQKLHSEQWDEVLKLSAEGAVRNKMTCYYTNVALLKTNNLSNYLFAYPQIGGVDGMELSAYEMRTSDMIYDAIGAPMEALHCSFENYVSSGKNRYNLPKLIYYYDKTNKPHIADRFAALFPLHKRAKPTGYVSQGADSSLVGISIINTLEAVCNADTLNRPAFEYLMAYYAMSGRIVKFIDNIDRALSLFNGTLPPYYQEIILLYKEVLPIEQQRQIAYNVPKSKIEQFSKFKDSIKKRGASTSQFQSTYWFYNKYLNPAGEKLYTN